MKYGAGKSGPWLYVTTQESSVHYPPPKKNERNKITLLITA